MSLTTQFAIDYFDNKSIPIKTEESSNELVDINNESFNTYNLAFHKVNTLPLIYKDMPDEIKTIEVYIIEVVDEHDVTSRSSYRESNYLLNIENPDTDYHGTVVTLSAEERRLVELKVMGEAGNQGFVGAALVGQAIRDGLTFYKDIGNLFSALSYSGKMHREPNEDVIKAVNYIFDEGKSAVQHRLIYFYNPELCDSSFHESQNFIIEYKNHKFYKYVKQSLFIFFVKIAFSYSIFNK
jgi:hypothetical protein